MIKVELERVTGDFGFRAVDAATHEVFFDTSTEHGGNNDGVRPMQSLLMALGACSGIDVITILIKQKQNPGHFRIRVEGERKQDGAVSLWDSIFVTFQFDEMRDEEKAKKACALSIEKYCSVAETLRRAGARIEWAVQIKY